MARRFTRREFHDLVWSKPIVHVARDFGLSDVAVHKICRKHGIPTPPPGWWAKQRAGKRVRRIELTQTEDEADVVVAASDLGDRRTSLAAVREEARVRACRVSTDVDGSRDPVVRRTLSALRAAMPSADGVLRVAGAGLVRCEVGSGSIERVGLILSRLAAAAAAQGFALDEGERGARFAGAGEALAVSVVETISRVRHEPTSSERKEIEAWERRRSKGSPSWRHDFSLRPTFPEWDRVASGRLGIELEGVRLMGQQGPRSTFRDGRVQRLEDVVDDVAVALAVLAAAKRDERERRRERELARLEEQRVRELPLRARFVAGRRRDALDAVLAELADLDRFGRLLHGLDAIAEVDREPRVSALLDFARREFEERGASLSASGLESRFADARVFGEDDDHSFRPPLRC